MPKWVRFPEDRSNGVALAKLLTETRAEHRHTLLIMDEPTNHLDVDMVEWLEKLSE